MIPATQKPLSDHLKDLRDRSGLSLDAVAEAGGYRGRSSVQRYFDDPSIETIAPAAARKLARALIGRGNPPITIQDLARLVFRDPGGDDVGLEAAARILQVPHSSRIESSSAVPVRSGMLPIMGAAHATSWMERQPLFDEPEDWLAIPFHSYQAQPGQYVLRIIGPSVNKTAPEGHYAICQKYGEANHNAPSGKFVHVERLRGDFVEWTIKKVRWEAGGMTLWPDSDHPDHQEPIDMGEPGVTVRIVGLVTGWYRPA